MTTTEQIIEEQAKPAWQRFESAEDIERRWSLVREHMNGEIGTYPEQRKRRSSYGDSISTHIIESTAFNFRIPDNMLNFILAQKGAIDRAEQNTDFNLASGIAMIMARSLKKDMGVLKLTRELVENIKIKAAYFSKPEP